MNSPNQARTTNLVRIGSAALLLLASIGRPAPAQSTAAASSPAIGLRTDVHRVDVDVVVTDDKGRPVTGLTQNDFKVEEDRKPQSVRAFDVHTIAPDTNFVAPGIPVLPANTFLNLAKAPNSGTPTVILYDALNTEISDQLFGHKEILNLLRHRRPGTQFAIFILTEKLHLLQGFTEDTSLLSAALASKRGSPQTTTLLAPSSGITATSASPNVADNVQDPDEAYDDFLLKAQEFDELKQLQLQDQRVELTLNALTDLGRFLGQMPGRKDLIWLSSAFPVDLLPDPTMTADKPQFHDRDMRDYSGRIRQATDLLNRGHVSVYPVDLRGLRTNPDLSAQSNAAYGGNPTFGGPMASLTQARNPKRGTTSNSINLSQQTFIQGDMATRRTMDSIADSTGGHAFYGTNGLQEAVNTALLSGSTYYSLTYGPTNSTYDGSLRHIKVTLNKLGYHLAYRSVYYADDLDAVARKVADAPQNPLTPSLERGTPLAHDLLLEAHLETSGPPTPATPQQMQTLSQFRDPLTLKAKPKPVKEQPILMQQYLISYGLIARQLQLTPDDTGDRQASLEFGVISYDEDGRKLNGLDTHIDDKIPPARYSKLLTDGYHVVQSIAVPTTAASIRIAVRDARTNQTGSLEVQLPLAKPAGD